MKVFGPSRSGKNLGYRREVQRRAREDAISGAADSPWQPKEPPTSAQWRLPVTGGTSSNGCRAAASARPRKIRRSAVRVGGGLLLTALMVLHASPALAALWYENYDRAEKAMAAEDWARAVELLEQAIAQEGESGVDKRTYGLNFINYFPYLQLGIAHYNLGNYDAAVTALEREEQLGAIAGAQGEMQQLREFRDLAQQALTAAADEARNREVSESLARASTFEAQGQLADALTEVNKALAIDGENAEANAAATRLQAAIGAEQERRDRQDRFDSLLARGRQLLDQQQFDEAAGVLTQATQLDPASSAAQSLLEEAQSGLTAQLQAEQDAETRRTTIVDGLRNARRLEGEGQFAQAIQELQSVLALDPQNREAIDLQQRLLVAQEEFAANETRNETVLSLLREATQDLAAGEFERSLSLVSRALSIDPLSPDAVRLLQQVQRQFRIQVGAAGASPLPPMIAFHDDRRAAGRGDDDTKIEFVSYPNFLLNGAIHSNSSLAVLQYTVGDTAVDLLGGEVQLLADGKYMTQFQVDRMLSAGLSKFAILATDSEGKSTQREYAVRYRVPFYLATWFYGVLLAVAVAVAATLIVRHEVERRKKLKRRFNPYIAGAPILKDEQYFGRDDLMERVLQTVHNNSILLYGERRIGKTSFQHRLKKRLRELNDPRFQFYPVYIDLQGIPETKFFATLAHDVFDELGPLLHGVEPSPALHGDAQYGYRDLVRDIRSVLDALNNAAPKRAKLVLLIDEVDELNNYDPRVNQRLRSLFMKGFAEDLVAVVSGVGIKKGWESEGSPWYNFFEEIQVKPLQPKEATELIEHPIRGVFKLDDGVADRIISLTDSRPYLIQKLCVELVNRAHEGKRRKITVADVESVGPPTEV
jgi:tetratricopeptide (TPR) repeat protein